MKKLETRETIDELLEAHPRLTREAVLEAIAFAARCLLANEVEQHRERIAELIEAIIAQATARRAAMGIEPLGAEEILRQQPFSQPAKTKRSPAPPVHVASKRVRSQMRIAYAWFARAFREAAEYLRDGDQLARFPKGSFPAGLLSVRAVSLGIKAATQVESRPLRGAELARPLGNRSRLKRGVPAPDDVVEGKRWRPVKPPGRPALRGRASARPWPLR